MMSHQEKRIVKCPFCQTKFYVHASLLVEQQYLKCSHCQNCWMQDPKDIGSSSELPSPYDFFPTENNLLTPMRFIVNEQTKKKTMDPVPALERQNLDEEITPLKKRWQFSWLVFFIPVFLFFVGKSYILSTFPVLENVYETLGLTSSFPQGFEIRNTFWHEKVEDGVPFLVVTGEIANMSSELREAPSLQVVLRGKGGCRPMNFSSYIFGDDKVEGEDGLCVLDRWSLDVWDDRLLPGQIVPFKMIRPYEVPNNVKKVHISFKKQE